jgi:hypothetical protein
MMHQRTKIVAGVSIGMCVVAVTLFFGALYMLSQKKVALTELASQIAMTKARENELTALARIVESTRTERAELHTRILTEEGVIDFLSLIETLAKEQGVALVTDTLTVGEMSPQFESLNVKLSLSGSYEKVLHVLEMFETLPYQASVVRTSFSNSEPKQGSGWQADIELEVTKLKKP